MNRIAEDYSGAISLVEAPKAKRNKANAQLESLLTRSYAGKAISNKNYDIQSGVRAIASQTGYSSIKIVDMIDTYLGRYQKEGRLDQETRESLDSLLKIYSQHVSKSRSKFKADFNTKLDKLKSKYSISPISSDNQYNTRDISQIMFTQPESLSEVHIPEYESLTPAKFDDIKPFELTREERISRNKEKMYNSDADKAKRIKANLAEFEATKGVTPTRRFLEAPAPLVSYTPEQLEDNARTSHEYDQVNPAYRVRFNETRLGRAVILGAAAVLGLGSLLGMKYILKSSKATPKNTEVQTISNTYNPDNNLVIRDFDKDTNPNFRVIQPIETNISKPIVKKEISKNNVFGVNLKPIPKKAVSQEEEIRATMRLFGLN